MLTIPRKNLIVVLAVLLAVSLQHEVHAGGSHGHGGHGHGGGGHGYYHGAGYHGGGYHGGGYHGHGHYYGHGYYRGYYGGYYPYGYYGRGYYASSYPYGYYPGYYGYYAGWAPVALAGGVAAGVAIAEAGRTYDDPGAYAEIPAANGSESCAVVRRVKDIDGRGVRMAATICMDQDGRAYVVQGSEYVLDK